jgi:predicted phage terminase large subunit-like protein
MGDYIYARKKGDILCAAREGKAELAKIKKEIVHYAFAAQYQQEPIAVDGGFINIAWFQKYATLPVFERIYQSWDTAIKIGAKNDYSACVIIGVSNDNYYIVDVFKKKLAYPELKQAVIGRYHAFNPVAVIIEDKASGQQLLQDLIKSKINLLKFSSRLNKEVRCIVASNIIEAGKVFLPKNAIWLDEFCHEVASFPNAQHDDQVDALIQLLLWQQQSKKLNVNFKVRRL